jgi:hypothetical protein
MEKSCQFNYQHTLNLRESLKANTIDFLYSLLQYYENISVGPYCCLIENNYQNVTKLKFKVMLIVYILKQRAA